MSKPDDLGDIGELSGIKNSSALRQLLSLRKDFLQREVNSFVRAQEWIKAFGALSKLDDIDKLYEMINKTIEELKKGGADGS